MAFDEAGDPFKPWKIKAGDAIFVSMNYLNFFLDHVLPMIDTPFVLITSNGDGTIDERYLPYLENPVLAAWFGRNVTQSLSATMIWAQSGEFPSTKPVSAIRRIGTLLILPRSSKFQKGKFGYTTTICRQ